MDQEFYISLIQKEFLQEISAEESKQLDSWKNTNAENESFYQDIISAWNYSEGYGEDLDVNLDQEFNIVQEKISNSESNVKPATNINESNIEPIKGDFSRNKDSDDNAKKLVPNWLLGLAVAAALLVFGIYYFPFLNDENSNTVFAKNTKIELSDGSIIVAQKGSSVDYPETFDGTTREISFKGNAYFSIADNSEKPFIINSPNLSTKVLGTTFFIEDVSENKEASVDLLEGKLEVKSDGDKQILVSGESVILESKSSKLIKNNTIETADFKWLDQNLLSFSDKPLEEVITVIGNLFGKNIQVGNHLASCSFSGELPFKDIDYMLDLLKGVYGVEVEKQNGVYILNGGKCN